MAWEIKIDKNAEKELSKLDKQVAIRILKFLRDQLSKLDNPRLRGEALVGTKLGNFWKYRVGDYRLICTIKDELLIVNVVKIGNRREVYN